MALVDVVFRCDKCFTVGHFMTEGPQRCLEPQLWYIAKVVPKSVEIHTNIKPECQTDWLRISLPNSIKGIQDIDPGDDYGN